MADHQTIQEQMQWEAWLLTLPEELRPVPPDGDPRGDHCQMKILGDRRYLMFRRSLEHDWVKAYSFPTKTRATTLGEYVIILRRRDLALNQERSRPALIYLATWTLIAA
ncbi:hypothetical protein RhiJN_15105 [Ceratobasidium sp. AG-Ba]|nr:hypothetical protein RhiJN_15105 [Ceratobasidium sp. AG-Ba]